MKIAVLADIHGNLEAFETVMADIRKERPDRIISLGDNIGYGADSETIINLLEKYDIESVLGNHELAITFPPFIKWFNPTSKQAVSHSIASLSEKSKETIRRFKKSIAFQGMRFVHGAPPSSVALYLFQITDRKLSDKISKTAETVCFTGHTHDIGVIESENGQLTRKKLKKGITRLSGAKKYVVNIGSVGQPRDETNHAKYVIYNTETMTIDLRYVEYDFKTAADKIKDAGLPEEFARKLYPLEKR